MARLLDECADEWTSERHGAQVHVVAVFDGFGVMDALVRSQRLLQALHATWTPLHTSVSDERSALVARTSDADASDDALDGSSPATVDTSDDRAMPRRPRAGLG